MTDRGKLFLKASAVALLAFISAIVFSAYLRPDMLVAFGDLMSFCASLLK